VASGDLLRIKCAAGCLRSSDRRAMIAARDRVQSAPADASPSPGDRRQIWNMEYIIRARRRRRRRYQLRIRRRAASC